MNQPPLTLTLEFARAEGTEDPFGFRFAPQAYLLRTAGGGYQQGRLPWDEALLADLESARDAAADPAVLVRLGERLRQFVTPLGWPQIATQVSQAAAQGRRVLLTIRSAAAELYALPWEFLTLDAGGQHVGALPSVLVRYEWPETATRTEQPLPRAGVGRILLAWSAAGGAVPAAEQIDAVARACQAGSVPLHLAHDVLAHASLRRLSDALAQAARDGQPISVLHILCHGGETGSTFGLVLNGDTDSAAAITVDADRLRQVLGAHANMVRLVVLSACDSGNSGRIGNQLGSVAQALHRAGIAAVVASRYPLSVAGSIRFTHCLYTALLEHLASLERALLDARTDLSADATQRDWASIQLYAREADGPDTRPLQFRPYPGLAAFDRDQRRFYFGREALTRKLWRRCQDLAGDANATRLLAILAPSGFGKSSVARAGLLVEIDRHPLSFAAGPDGAQPARIATMKPGAHPLSALQSALTTAPTTAPQVLLVDQFEEIYTLCSDPAERDAFVDRLLTAARLAGNPTLIVITLRTDFIGEAGQKHPALYRLLDAQSQFVDPMGIDDLRRSISDPAAALGRPLDDATIDLLLTQVQGHEGALPLLEFALSQIWEGMLAGHAPADTLRQIGGVGGALAGKAREIYDALGGPEQATARRALVRLVRLGEGTRDTRRRAPVAELCGRGETEASVLQVLRKFASEQARLVTLAGAGADTQAEVTHETLFEHWADLRSWIEQGRKDRGLYDRALAAARLWAEAGKPTGRLWRPPDLDLLREYQRRKPEDLGPLPAAFLAAAVRRRIRERALTLGGLAALIATLIGAVAIYVAKERRIRQQLLDSYVDRGRQLLFESGRPSEALLWLQRAQVEGSRDSALPDLLTTGLHAAGTPRAVLAGHTDRVLHASYSRDGQRIVTASDDKTARVWDAQSGRPLGPPLQHPQHVASAAFSPDGRHILTVGDDGIARVWGADNSGVVVELKAAGVQVSGAAYSPTGHHIVTACLDGTARVWDAGGGGIIAELKGHAAAVYSAAYSPNGRRIVTASADHTARVWDADSGGYIAPLVGHEAGIHDAAYSPDGRRIVTSAEDNTARVWDAERGSLIATLEGHRDRVESAAFAPDGQRVVTASRDNTARVWDATHGTMLTELRGHTGNLAGAAFSPDGRHIVTASLDNTARIWEADSGALLATLRGHRDGVQGATYGPDGSSILTASSDGTARRWQANHGLPSGVPLRHEDGVESATFAADGGRVVALTAGGRTWVWDAKGGKCLLSPGVGQEGTVRSATVSPDGRRIVTAHWGGKAAVWTVGSDGAAHSFGNAQQNTTTDATGAYACGWQPVPLVGHEGSVLRAAFSPDGRRIVTTSEDKTACLWDADSGALRKKLEGHQITVLNAAFSPNGRRVVTASDDETARVWDAESGAPLRELRGHERSVWSATFSPDGRRIVTASDDATARVWDADSGTALRELRGHQGSVWSAIYSPDGRHVLTASADGTARIWDPERGTPHVVLEGAQASVWTAVYRPDGLRIVTASADKTVRVWDAMRGRLLAELKGHAAPVRGATYSPDGRQVATASLDGTVRLWDMAAVNPSPDQLARFMACALPVRFDPSSPNIIVPNTPTAEQCKDAMLRP